MNDREVVHIVLCGDANVLWGMAATVRSALENATGPLGVNILGGSLAGQDIQKLVSSWRHPNLAYTRFFEVDWRLSKQFRSTRYLKSKAAYFRFFLAEFIKDINRCIYLDTDLLVFRDLYALRDLDLEGNLIAAVRDVSVRNPPNQAVLHQFCLDLRERLGLTDPMSYFNSGFLVIDLEKWRQAHIKEQLVNISTEMCDKMHSQDQDALNIVMQGKTKLLDGEWNTSQYEHVEDYSKVVLHLIGSVKPWHHDYRYHHGWRFFDVLSRTDFSTCRPASAGSFAALKEKLMRQVPTIDMVTGKIRRMTRAVV